MTKIILKDREVRDLIASDIKSNLLVEAGAGSGKTSEMANRIVALVSSGYRKIDEIVAITFTRKAANELKDRVRRVLEDRYSATEDLRLKESIDHLHECFIGTIHSFCSKLIRERPIEAGIDPAFIEIEEAEDQIIRQKVWEMFVANATEDQKNLLDLMNNYGVKEEVTKNFMKLVCEQQDIEFELPDEDEIGKAEIEKQIAEAYDELESAVKAGRCKIPQAILDDEDSPDDLQKSILRFLQKTKNRRNIKIAEKLMLISMFSTASSVKVTQKRWGEDKELKQAAKALGESFEKLQTETIKPAMSLCESFAYNYLLIPFAKQAKELYIKHKLCTAALNFQDLLLGAANLLREYPEVRAYFQRKYKTLLVDEFQDTDPIQAQMVMYLAGQDIQEKKWDRLVPKEGSLFVVGDPKQSIYSFRRADLEIYNRVKEIIRETGGKVIELTTNFRSVNELGSWFGDTFDSLLNHGTKYEGVEQAGFAGLHGVSDSLPETLSGVSRYHIDEKKKAAIMAKEPELLARVIHWMVGKKDITASEKDTDGSFFLRKRKLEYKDIMILSTKKRIMETLAARLSSFGIPVKVTGADIIKKAPEFFEFSNIIRMISYPEESAYVYNVMENDRYGFTDHDLFHYVSLGGIFNIYYNLDELKQKHEDAPEALELLERVDACFKQLKRFVNYAKYMTPAAATERIVEELGLLGKHLSSNEDLTGLGSFISLIEKIRLKDISDIWGLDLFINEIRYMIENGFEEEIDIEGCDFNAVRIMNTHKAKGLEAPVVILSSPCSGTIPEPTFYVKRVMDEGSMDQYLGYARLKKHPDSYAKDYFAPKSWGKIHGAAIAKAELERDRLLYVAATRARNLLIISSSATKDNPWNKLLDLLPQSTKNIMEEVYREEPFDELPKFKTEVESPEIHIDDKLSEIRKRRNEAINNNLATYEMCSPSQKKMDSKSEHENQDYEQERKIVENTVTVFMRGDEEVTEADRLELGTAVHKLFETIIKDDSRTESIIKWISEKTDLEYLDEELLHNIADSFRSSKILERINQSEEVYTEVPFSFKVGKGEDFAGLKPNQECYVSGYIDLIFKEQDGWTVLDYKTCNPHEVKHELQKFYQPQLDAYKEVWEKITGEKVKGTELFFIEKHMVSAMDKVV